MIDSVTIFSKTGFILYHYSFVHHSNDLTTSQTNAINQFISLHLTSPLMKLHYLTSTTPESIAEYHTTSSSSTSSTFNSNSNSTSLEQKEDCMVVILYPKVISQHADMTWTNYYMTRLLQEYHLFESTRTRKHIANNSHDDTDHDHREYTLFNATNQALYDKSQLVGKTSSVSVSVPVPSSSTNTTTMTTSSSTSSLSKKSKKLSSSAKPPKKGKEGQVWYNNGEQKVTSKSMAKLDRSKASSNSNLVDSMNITDSSPALMEARAAYLPTDNDVPAWEEEEEALDDTIDDDGDDNDGNNNDSKSSNTNASAWGSSLKDIMNQVSGKGKVLTSSDLDAPLQEMEKLLTGKNVAQEIAQEICQRVRDKLIGRKMTSFTRVKTAVRQALEGAIEKILKPGKGRGGSDDVDVLRDVVTKRERGKGSGGGIFGRKQDGKNPTKPYVIVMVGINGVGKSTSLAKIAYYLKSNGCNPLLAACDTFRSGAVEQLNVHAKCLKVPLYHKGYAKDPSSVAKAAIDHATQEGNDVVLVDTAGRMQNNVPLMKALSNLVVQNDPDLVLFVCEALVGNDGMDQLQMFDKALRSASASASASASGGHHNHNERRIDGIVLTKFDTVSDKVGAALTMTHLTGAPVVFCGTGQKYNHLKKLSVQSVIKSLFS